MSDSLDTPKPITRVLPLIEKYRQKLLSQNLEEQDTLLAENASSESGRPKNRQGFANTNLVAVVVLSFTIVVGSLTWLSISVSPQSRNPSKSLKSYTDCGSNYSTAIAAGCIYDIVAPQWMPPECYNATISKEHYSKIPKPMFFRWPNLTEPVSEDALEISQYDTIWTFDEYHTIHCTYMLELAALAAAMTFSGHQDVYLNSISANFKHTKHCTELLSSNTTSPGPTEIRHPGGTLRCNALSPR